MVIRKAELADIEEIISVEARAWPVEGVATAEQFKARIETFPDGVLVAELDGRVVGVVVGEKVNLDQLKEEGISWHSITDGGFIKKSHNPSGDTLYGVDLSVDPQYQHRGIGRRLLQEIGKMAIKSNLKAGVLGARMPDYHKFAHRFTPEEYLNFRDKDGKLVDEELRFYERSGLKLLRAIKNYFPDSESGNYGVLAIWKNPFYVRNAFLGKILGFIGSLLFKI